MPFPASRFVFVVCWIPDQSRQRSTAFKRGNESHGATGTESHLHNCSFSGTVSESAARLPIQLWPIKSMLTTAIWLMALLGLVSSVA